MSSGDSSLENRKEQFAKEHEKFMQELKIKAESLAPVVDLLNLDKKKVGDAIAKTFKDVRKMSNQEPPPFKSDEEIKGE